MKHNYALGIKKIIILWIVVFLGGYVLNSFFKKINSLDEGLYTRSLKIPRGFRVDFNRGGEGYEARLRNRNFARGRGIGNVPVSQIKVSMIANQTPAPASVSGASGCGGPTFGKTRKEFQAIPGVGRGGYPIANTTSYRVKDHRKLSKSECQMLKREEECRPWKKPPQKGWKKTVKGKLTHNLILTPGIYTSSDRAVLPVVSFSKHGMGCVIVPDGTRSRKNSEGHNYDKKVGYRIVWNVGCKGSTSDCGGRPTTANWGQVFSQHKPPKHTRGPVIIKVAASAISAKSKNYNKRSNWDKWYIPIEAGDGIPRKKKAAPAPKPKPKPIPNPLDGKLCEWNKDVTKSSGPRAPGCKYWETRRNSITSVSGQVLGLRACQDARWGGSWQCRLTAAGRKQLGM